MSNALAMHLARTGQTQTEFGRKINRSPATVSRLCNGKGSTDRETLLAVFLASGGEVTPNGLYGIPPEREAA